MKESVRVRDLPEQPKPGVMLFCPDCQGEFSATRGDYFMLSPDYVMTCCDGPLWLVREQRILEDVE